MKNKLEYRYFPADVTECRILDQEDGKFLEGRASIFNSRSKLIFENGKWFYEIISSNAFDRVLQDEQIDVPMTYNHNRGQLLGRTKSGSLQLFTDERGLNYRVSLPNTATGNEVYELAKRGDLYENSFAFIVTREDEEWSKDEEGNNIRTIKNVSKLADVSIVINGAYANTDVAARSLEEFEQEEQRVKNEEDTLQAERQKKLNVLKRQKANAQILAETLSMRTQILKLKK